GTFQDVEQTVTYIYKKNDESTDPEKPEVPVDPENPEVPEDPEDPEIPTELDDPENIEDPKTKEDTENPTVTSKMDDGSSDKKLPKTATSYYIAMLVGLLTILIGGGIYIFN